VDLSFTENPLGMYFLMALSNLWRSNLLFALLLFVFLCLGPSGLILATVTPTWLGVSSGFEENALTCKIYSECSKKHSASTHYLNRANVFMTALHLKETSQVK